MDFATFKPLLWLLVLPGLGAAYFYSLVDRPRGLMIGSFGLRMLGIVLLVLALCQPFISQKSDDVHVVFLVDVSQSVDLASAKDALNQVEAGLKNLRSGDSASLFALGDGLREKSLEDFRKMLDAWMQGVADDA